MIDIGNVLLLNFKTLRSCASNRHEVINDFYCRPKGAQAKATSRDETEKLMSQFDFSTVILCTDVQDTRLDFHNYVAFAKLCYCTHLDLNAANIAWEKNRGLGDLVSKHFLR